MKNYENHKKFSTIMLYNFIAQIYFITVNRRLFNLYHIRVNLINGKELFSRSKN